MLHQLRLVDGPLPACLTCHPHEKTDQEQEAAAWLVSHAGFLLGSLHSCKLEYLYDPSRPLQVLSRWLLLERQSSLCLISLVSRYRSG